MNVQELFKSINEDEFLDLYLRNDRESIDMLFNTKYTPEEKFKKLQYYRQIVLDAFRECKNMQIKESSDDIVFVVPNFDGDTSADSFVCKKEEVLNYENIERVEHYGYDLSPRDEVLGYIVSEASRHIIDDDINLAVNIFNEMTFCGITNEHHTDKVNDLLDKIKESEEEIKEHPECCKPIEELFKELGFVDKRTPYEKEFDLSLAKLEGESYVKLFKKYLELELYYYNKNERNEENGKD